MNNLTLRIKQLEKQIEMNPNLFPGVINFENIPEDELKRWYEKEIIGIKTKFDLNDSEVEIYFETLLKWEEIDKTNEIEAAKFWTNYEQGLIINKWEKVTGMKWETYSTNM